MPTTAGRKPRVRGGTRWHLLHGVGAAGAAVRLGRSAERGAAVTLTVQRQHRPFIEVTGPAY